MGAFSTGATPSCSGIVMRTPRHTIATRSCGPTEPATAQPNPIATRLLALLRRCSLLPALALGVASRIGAQTVAPAAAYSFVTYAGASRASMRVVVSEARPFD